MYGARFVRWLPAIRRHDGSDTTGKRLALPEQKRDQSPMAFSRKLRAPYLGPRSKHRQKGAKQQNRGRCPPNGFANPRSAGASLWDRALKDRRRQGPGRGEQGEPGERLHVVERRRALVQGESCRQAADRQERRQGKERRRALVRASRQDQAGGEPAGRADRQDQEERQGQEASRQDLDQGERQGQDGGEPGVI